MSGIKGVIKYISQLLILSSFSIIFLPIICLKCYEEKSEISIFKFMQWSIGKSTKSFLDADMEFVIGRQMKIYIVCALIWVMVNSNFYNHNSSCAVTVIILYCDCCTAFYNFEWWIDLSDALYGNERPDFGKNFQYIRRLSWKQKHCFR